MAVMAAILSGDQQIHFKANVCLFSFYNYYFIHLFSMMSFFKKPSQKCFLLFHMQREVMAEDEVTFVIVS